MQKTIEEQAYRDYIGRLVSKGKTGFKYILRQDNATKTPIPIRGITKNLRLSPSRTSQLVTSLEQYDIITTQVQYSKDGGKFRTIQPDEWLVERVAKGRYKSKEWSMKFATFKNIKDFAYFRIPGCYRAIRYLLKIF